MQKKKAGSFINSGNSTSNISTPTRSTSKHHVSNTSGLSIISSGVCLSTVNTISTTGSASGNSGKYATSTLPNETMVATNQHQFHHQQNTIALSVCGLDSQFSTYDSGSNDNNTVQINRNINMDSNEQNNRTEYTLQTTHNIPQIDSHYDIGHNINVANISQQHNINISGAASGTNDGNFDVNCTNVGAISAGNNVITIATNLSQICNVSGIGTSGNGSGIGGGSIGISMSGIVAAAFGGSSSTGSNVVCSTSKTNAGTSINNNHTNVVFEVHDWWTDQAIAQQSSEDEGDNSD